VDDFRRVMVTKVLGNGYLKGTCILEDRSLGDGIRAVYLTGAASREASVSRRTARGGFDV
jgi:hypothetical protein